MKSLIILIVLLTPSISYAKEETQFTDQIKAKVLTALDKSEEIFNTMADLVTEETPSAVKEYFLMTEVELIIKFYGSLTLLIIGIILCILGAYIAYKEETKEYWNVISAFIVGVCLIVGPLSIFIGGGGVYCRLIELKKFEIAPKAYIIERLRKDLK